MVEWNIDGSPVLAVRGVKSAVSYGVDVLASHQASDFGVGVSLLEGLSFSSLFVIQAEYVICSPSFIGISNLILVLHRRYPLTLSVLFILHVLPSFEISFVFLDPIFAN